MEWSQYSMAIGRTIFINRTHKIRALIICLSLLFICLYFIGNKQSIIRGYIHGNNGPDKGLVSSGKKFYLNGKQFKILSGSMHYFRVLPQQWRDRLLKMKACGLNTVTTYVAWNVHEEEKGIFKFSGNADIRRFVQIAGGVGLHVIIRPGPYICSEWEYGGLPSWLLRDPKMEMRSMYPGFIKAAELFWEYFIYEIIDLQYMNGGPIIAFQIENELGSYKDDVNYMNFLKSVLTKRGIDEAMFSCNGASGMTKGWLPGSLMTANFGLNKKSGTAVLDYIRKWEPDMALFVTEFWDGWFDHWQEPEHHTVKSEDVVAMLKWMFEEKDVQGVNFYMFHGGTNFGFWNGANNDSGLLQPTVTSYDYNAPISESGEMTEKCLAIKDYFEKTMPNYAGSLSMPKDVQFLEEPVEYGSFPVSKYLPLPEFSQVFSPGMTSEKPVNIEMIVTNRSMNGQSFGFTHYAANFPPAKTLLFTDSVRDRALVYVNGEQLKVIDSSQPNRNLDISRLKLLAQNKLEVLVENMGRINFFRNNDPSIHNQRKGLMSDVLLDSKTPIRDWTITPMEFTSRQIAEILSLPNWRKFTTPQVRDSAVYYIEALVISDPRDTFLTLPNWTKGVVFVNGFNVGRYWNTGPQRTLYIPAPLLHTGTNQFVIYELHTPGTEIHLGDKPDLGPEPSGSRKAP